MGKLRHWLFLDPNLLQITELTVPWNVWMRRSGSTETETR